MWMDGYIAGAFAVGLHGMDLDGYFAESILQIFTTLMTFKEIQVGATFKHSRLGVQRKIIAKKPVQFIDQDKLTILRNGIKDNYEFYYIADDVIVEPI